MAQQKSPIVIFGGAFLAIAFGFAIFGGLYVWYDSTSHPQPAPQSQVSIPPVAPASPSLSDIPLSGVAWSEVDAIYNLKNNYTDLQKDEYWKQYKGKKVSWTGRVSSVSDSLGSLTLQVKMNPDTFSSDVIVTLQESQRSKALDFKVGDQVTFTGILDKWGSIMPVSLNEGEIE
jgi:hypothetical protein